MIMAMRWQWSRLDGAEVPHATAPVVLRITVETLAPGASAGHSDPVVVARYGREVESHQREVARALALAQIDQHAHVRVVAINPLEALGREIQLPQRGGLLVELVEVAHPVLHPGVLRILQHVPLEAGVMGP